MIESQNSHRVIVAAKLARLQPICYGLTEQNVQPPPQTIPNRSRITVDGKFFRRGAEKFFVKGITYGPFAPNAQGEPFASPEKTAQDFVLIRELGANVLRVYDPPPRWLLDLAAQSDLLLLVDVPWFSQHSEINPSQAREAVRKAVTQCATHPAVFAFSVVNEITPEAAKNFGVAATIRLIENLIAEAKHLNPDCLYTFANYPPAEFLQPRNLDFACFNIYFTSRSALSKNILLMRKFSQATNHCCSAKRALIHSAKVKHANAKFFPGKSRKSFAAD